MTKEEKKEINKKVVSIIIMTTLFLFGIFVVPRLFTAFTAKADVRLYTSRLHQYDHFYILEGQIHNAGGATAHNVRICVKEIYVNNMRVGETIIKNLGNLAPKERRDIDLEFKFLWGYSLRYKDITVIWD